MWTRIVCIWMWWHRTWVWRNVVTAMSMILLRDQLFGRIHSNNRITFRTLESTLSWYTFMVAHSLLEEPMCIIGRFQNGLFTFYYIFLYFISDIETNLNQITIKYFQGAVRNLVSRGVVVVTIQYRVGLFGFFTTFTEQFPPNRGFFDMVAFIWLLLWRFIFNDCLQILALRWVNEEIANFGGDVNR